MKTRTAMLLLLSLILISCASTRQREVLVSEIQMKGNDSALTARLEKGEELSISEIVQLRKIDVSVESIISYIKNTRTVYMLSKADVARLQQIPGNEQLIEFLLKTPQLYHPDNIARRDPYATPDSAGGYVPYYQQPY